MTADKTDPVDEMPDPSRRNFLNSAAFVGLAGLSVGLSGCNKEAASSRVNSTPTTACGRRPHRRLSRPRHALRTRNAPGAVLRARCPGRLGDHQRIEGHHGHQADGSLRYTVGDTHHTHASYKDGNYDGRYAWVNDKINAASRASASTTSSATRSPNCPTSRASTASSRTSATRSTAINHTTRVFCGAEFHIPLPNDGRDADAREVPCAVHLRRCRVHGSALAGADRRQLRPRRHLLRRQAGRRQPVQHRGRRQVRRHDVGRARRLRVLQRRRIEQAVKDGKFKTFGASQGAGGRWHQGRQPIRRPPSSPTCRCPRTRTASTPARTASTSSAPASCRPPPP
jgi:nitrous-oxide reductase